MTLPGAPFVVAGSNGHVAWGFTNSEGDWADLVVLEPDPGNPDAYLTPEGPRTLERGTETIEVAGEKAETLDVESTIWGPVIDKDHAGRRRALAWVALREGGLNAALVRMESAASLDEAQALAPEAGMPNQNFVVADAAGRIGWTIIGRIPRRVGPRRERAHVVGGRDAPLGRLARPGRLPPRRGPAERAHLDGQRARRRAERSSRRWAWAATTSARARARSATTSSRIEKASESDMLRIQLDDRALFLARWQELLLGVLTPEAVAQGRPPRRGPPARGGVGRARRPSTRWATASSAPSASG